MSCLSLYIAAFNSGPEWSSIHINIWQAIIFIFVAILCLAVFKFSYLSIFLLILGLLAYGILFGNSRYTGHSQTLFWIQTCIVGVLSLVFYLRKRK